ncbi:Hypothetical_protein [Hexamita inflata]|uniref:Hypothetical_protein n=1 Tax=Hexamita inflata TaxID=28002 RepID=A0AA86Q8K1_9EUKA|nr:Hypothetical protein HINF_LOCUS41900 [Hexamita inflata]
MTASESQIILEMKQRLENIFQDLTTSKQPKQKLDTAIQIVYELQYKVLDQLCQKSLSLGPISLNNIIVMNNRFNNDEQQILRSLQTKIQLQKSSLHEQKIRSNKLGVQINQIINKMISKYYPRVINILKEDLQKLYKQLNDTRLNNQQTNSNQLQILNENLDQLKLQLQEQQIQLNNISDKTLRQQQIVFENKVSSQNSFTDQVFELQTKLIESNTELKQILEKKQILQAEQHLQSQFNEQLECNYHGKQLQQIKQRKIKLNELEAEYQKEQAKLPSWLQLEMTTKNDQGLLANLQNSLDLMISKYSNLETYNLNKKQSVEELSKTKKELETEINKFENDDTSRILRNLESSITAQQQQIDYLELKMRSQGYSSTRFSAMLRPVTGIQQFKRRQSEESVVKPLTPRPYQSLCLPDEIKKSIFRPVSGNNYK